MEEIEKKFRNRKWPLTNPKDPFFYFVYKNTLPPEEAYRVIHPKKDL
jgi:hypothetical protein